MAEKDIKLNSSLAVLNQPSLVQTKLITESRYLRYLYRVQLLEVCWDKECNSKGRPCN
jgi:hypothetical protein